jgi:hypothetical protein
MKTFKMAAIFGVVVAGTAHCPAQSDSDCTPSAQQVVRDMQADGTFSDDQTMQDLMTYVIAKCPGNQAGPSEVRTSAYYDGGFTAVLAGITAPVVLGPPPAPPAPKHRGKK